MAELSAFRVGHCTHPGCMALKGRGLASQCFPSRAYLIETSAGLMLWDTGYAERFAAASAQGIYRLYGWVTPVVFDPAESLSAQLAGRGIRASDIHTLILSHFHADHVAGLRDFPHARLLCARSAWEAVRQLRGWRALRQAFLPELMPDDIEARLHFVEALPERALPAALQPFGHGRDLTGRGEVFIVDLPGHAVGHLGAFVQTGTAWTLLASDAAWLAEGYQAPRGPSELAFLVQHDRAQYYRTLQRLHQLHQGGQATIRLSHEEAVDYPPPPGP